jgi:predicted Zn-dependent protease
MLSVQTANPAVADAAIIGTQQEIEIGKGVARDLEKKYGLVNDPELQARIARIGASIAAVSDRKDLPYSFKVLNSKDVNALAVPGGFVYVFKGLVDYMPSDHEIAGILAHEVGHISKRHTVVQIERSLAVGVIFAILFGEKAAILQDLVYSAIMAGYSRDAEKEADKMGVIYSNRAGYNPYSMLIGMEKLEDISQKPTFGLFSSHPDTTNRVNAVRDQIRNEFGVRPYVAETAKNAQIFDGNWNMPPYSVKYAGYSPVMRGYLTAGKIYRITRQADYSSDRLYINDLENAVGIYYSDDREPVAIITPQDAAATGMSTAEMASTFIVRIREWIGK